ncbi:helix-turn-helix transcriptional regulator [Fibrella forsythiae]|uniref:Helix-turn-helix transcriptional regulator n=1 Tax=Fibrella forsythiae TaxID=2817061 RepID=A0ABS3JT42_9BACT|nr:helix-turn-helix transcriptional regulator [Fibrella forsythiae]MBO0953123.1 helix-turn-helix transcriptional regulator [Fibrella forsythiae]
MKERLLLLIQHTGLSINQFEATLGAGNSSFRKIIDNDSGLSTKNIEKIFTTFPEYNLDWLLTGRGSMLLTTDSKPDDLTLPLAKPVRESVVMADTSDSIIVPILDTKAAAGSPYILDEADYYKELPTFAFPGFFFRSGVRVGIQVRGDSMHPTLKQGDYVIGREVEELTYLRNGEVHIVVFQEDHRLRFFVKRCYYFLEDASLILRSDNDDYPDESVSADAMMKLYQVEACYTTQFTRIESLRGKFDRIEKRIDRIEKQLPQDQQS